MKKTDRTTISIRKEVKLELQKAAIEISYKTGKPINWTEIVHFMIENYIKLAKEDIEEEKG